MRRLLAALLMTAGMLTFSPGTTHAVGDPLTCTGYPEPRVFQEAQQWWMPPGSEDFGHVHIGACFPRTRLPDGTPNKLTGTVHLDFVVKLHNNPGTFQFVRIHLHDATGHNQAVARVDVKQTCPTGDCTWVVPVNFNSALSFNDGYEAIRVAAIVTHPEHGGAKRFAGGSWAMYLANGKPVANENPAVPEREAGSNWYTGALYEEAELRSALPYTVSGIWQPQVRFAAGAGGKDVTQSFASVDPSFHAVPANEGLVVFDSPGPYKGALTIDTTVLTNGTHKLFLRSASPCDGTVGNDCGLKPDGTTNNTATHYSVQVFTIVVAN